MIIETKAVKESSDTNHHQLVPINGEASNQNDPDLEAAEIESIHAPMAAQAAAFAKDVRSTLRGTGKGRGTTTGDGKETLRGQSESTALGTIGIGILVIFTTPCLLLGAMLQICGAFFSTCGLALTVAGEWTKKGFISKL